MPAYKFKYFIVVETEKNVCKLSSLLKFGCVGLYINFCVVYFAIVKVCTEHSDIPACVNVIDIIEQGHSSMHGCMHQNNIDTVDTVSKQAAA